MEKEITSKNNALIKDLSKLSIKKYRIEKGLALVEGERFIGDLLHRKVKFAYIFYVEKPKITFPNDCECIKCTPQVIQALSQTVNSSNLVGVVAFEKRKFELPKTNFLILDKVSDPGNLGTIIRTALALDFKNIYLLNCVDYTNDKVLRATMGTIADINLYECEWKDLEKLRNFTIFDASMDGVDVDNIDKPTEIFGIILGNEANGVSEQVASLATKSVSIKMSNSVESLNVAVAGAILMSKLI